MSPSYVQSAVNKVSNSILALAILFSAGTASADEIADFYKGKTVTIQVAYGAGGGYDLVARVVVQFLGKHIPGNPKVVVENVPGGGGLKVANAIYNTAPKDGLTLGEFAADVALQPLYGDDQARFKAANFAWIGSMDTDIQSCGIWGSANADIKSLTDLIAAKRTIRFGSTSPVAPASTFPIFFHKALGAPTKVIAGYPGTNAEVLAIRQGEIDATCGLFESTVRGSYMHDLQSGDLKIFTQITEGERSPLFGDATPVMDVIKNDELRQVAQLVFGPSLLTRPLVAPPGTLPNRVAALKAALLATAKDDEVTAVAQKVIGAHLHPKSGEEVEKMIAGFESTPPDLVKKAYSYTHE
jgi:tripartite-type tricarboxylate transporter receptor subunit TctC